MIDSLVPPDQECARVQVLPPAGNIVFKMLQAYIFQHHWLGRLGVLYLYQPILKLQLVLELLVMQHQKQDLVSVHLVQIRFEYFLILVLPRFHILIL